MYDLDELDLNWLQSVNTKRKFRGVWGGGVLLEGWRDDKTARSCISVALASPKGLEEDTLREALLTLETKVEGVAGVLVVRSHCFFLVFACSASKVWLGLWPLRSGWVSSMMSRPPVTSAEM